jgi:nitroimidazol reductase NimA-like FMN-containing flavoprotein (pyridoxamine 5'-phosphate oxidase superfamily)
MVRKDISFTPEELDAFLAEEMTLIVTTIGKDGHPHTAPMWFFMEDGKIVFRSFTKSQKIVNLQRDPRITVLVERGIACASDSVTRPGTQSSFPDERAGAEIVARLSRP